VAQLLEGFREPRRLAVLPQARFESSSASAWALQVTLGSLYPVPVPVPDRSHCTEPVRYASVDTATERLRRHLLTRGTKENGPRSRDFAASGPFSLMVAGDGFQPS
jgi:hypothetical protein